jgi:subtilisin-like proprotein convertase family protein
VFKSTDFGHTFAAPINSSGTQADKPWIAVDNVAGAGQSNLYLCFTESILDPAEMRFQTSTNGGASFGAATTVAGGVPDEQVQGCHITVSPDHQVNLFYFKHTATGNGIFMRRSTDQGATFTPEQQIAALRTTTVNGDLELDGGFRTNSWPQCAVSGTPYRTYQYCIFNDQVSGSSDIYLVRSIDNGVTWSPFPVRANDDFGGDQFTPSIALNGNRIIIAYYSRSEDPAHIMFHRRARTGTFDVHATAFNPSFKLGPSTPVVIGRDPYVDPAYMGDYDQIATYPGQNPPTFSTTWSDNRVRSPYWDDGTTEPDVWFANVAANPNSADVDVSISASAASVTVGTKVLLTVNVGATSGTAQDVFFAMPPVEGLVFQSVDTLSGRCTLINGFVDCYMGTVAQNGSESVQITAQATTVGSKTVAVSATTSSKDANAANNSASTGVTVNPGSGVTTVYSSTTLQAIPDPDENGPIPLDIKIPVRDEGVVLNVPGVRVRLDHADASELILSLIGPTGTTVQLSSFNGDSQGYGSGPDTCGGTKTVFTDSASTSIDSGTPPFNGQYKPEQPLSAFVGSPSDGVWTLRVEDQYDNDNTGAVGCVQLVITRD